MAQERPPRWFIQLLLAFKNPFILLLLALAIISFLTGDLKATVVISVMVAVSVLLRFVLEYRSGRAAEKLKAMVSTTATVSRPDLRTRIPEAITASFGITRRRQWSWWARREYRLLVRCRPLGWHDGRAGRTDRLRRSSTREADQG